MSGQTIEHKKRFTKEEDEKLLKIVSIIGTYNWQAISDFMGNFTTRQCRERYNNYLKPGLNKAPFTPEEDKMLIEKVAVFGKKWKLISFWFKNRTPYAVKNHYKVLMNRKAKELRKKQEEELALRKLFPNQVFNFDLTK